MTGALQLFTRRGPDEPILPRGLCQSSPAYVAGREDFIFGRSRRTWPSDVAQYAYDCAWEHERREAADVARWMGGSH